MSAVMHRPAMAAGVIAGSRARLLLPAPYTSADVIPLDAYAEVQELHAAELLARARRSNNQAQAIEMRAHAEHCLEHAERERAAIEQARPRTRREREHDTPSLWSRVAKGRRQVRLWLGRLDQKLARKERAQSLRQYR